MKRTVLALALLFPGSAAAAPLEIGPGKTGISRLGDFRPQRDPSPDRAVAVFGAPTSKHGTKTVCTMRWQPLGLKVVFADFGGGDDACTQGKAQSFRATGDFVTWRGLKVGAGTGAVRRRHPSAVRHARSYWLKTAKAPYGEGTDYAVVKAVVGGGKVTALAGWIGAAGE
jgi:hypothetical protein